MATILKAGNVATGAQITSDATGILEVRTGTGAGTTAITVGTDQAVTMAGAVSSSSLTVNSNNISAVNSLGFRNRIINGAMVIDQRNAGAAITPTAAVYTLDRWEFAPTVASKLTIQQNAGSLSAANRPAGFINYLGLTSTSSYSVINSDFFTIRQNIEGLNAADLGWGTANASTVTLSFWARSSLTGTHSGSVYNIDGTRSYVFSFTVVSANTWEYKTITIAGDTTGTWLTTNAVGIRVGFSLGTGSTYSGTAGSWNSTLVLAATGSVSVVGTNNATFYITGVQLEAGSVATPFERRDYGRELIMCQRYFQRVGATDAGDTVAVATAFNTTDIYGVYNFKTTMRADPTGSASSAGALEYLSNGGAQNSTAIVFQLASPNQMEIVSTQSSRTAGYAGWWRFASAAAWIQFSAEL
jgi:hypothetical protein